MSRSLATAFSTAFRWKAVNEFRRMSQTDDYSRCVNITSCEINFKWLPILEWWMAQQDGLQTPKYGGRMKVRPPYFGVCLVESRAACAIHDSRIGSHLKLISQEVILTHRE